MEITKNIEERLDGILNKNDIVILNGMTEKKIVNMLGKWYVKGNFKEENTEFVEICYKEIAKINKELMKKIPYEVIFTEKDEYKSAKEMRDRVKKENIIYIYKGNSEHKYFSEKENWEFRAVHDVFAHLVCGCPFDFKGELTAYEEQRKLYPEYTWGVLFGEIPMQTCTYYYTNGFNFNQRAIHIQKDLMEYVTNRFKNDYTENSILKPFTSLN